MVGGPNGPGLVPKKSLIFGEKMLRLLEFFGEKKLKSNFLNNGKSQGLQSLYTFDRYYKALQLLLQALFTLTILQQNICRAVSQGENDRTGKDCIDRNDCSEGYQQCNAAASRQFTKAPEICEK